VKWCHKLPESSDYDESTLLEPLSVAIHATRRASMPDVSNCLIFGAGTVGILVGAMCKISGARTVTICDIDEGRVDFAMKNGFATLGVCSNGLTSDPLKLSTLLQEKAGVVTRGGFDRVFDCTGAEICVQTSIYSTLPGGKRDKKR
jgi:L-iditol 2-dehydrogenase